MYKEIFIYPAGPLGFSEAGRYFYEKVFIPMLKEIGFTVLDPWILTDAEIINEAIKTPYGVRQVKKWQKANKIIGANNAEAIKKSHIIVAILDGVDVDSGTASEIGFGAALNKPVIGYRGDFRLSADNVGSIVNLQVEYFINLNGGKITTSIDELKQLLIKWHDELHVMEDY